MQNTTVIAIGVVIPLVLLFVGAGAFIWVTERRRREEPTIVSEIPHRPRITSYLYRNKHRHSARIADGIEVCSPRPSTSKQNLYSVESKVEYGLPSLHFAEDRTDSAVQSPTVTSDELSELEGTLGKRLQSLKRPSKAQLRHSSVDEYCTNAETKQELPSRASLQPPEHYQQRQTLQPLATTNHRDLIASNNASKDGPGSESKEGSNSPTVSAVSELSGQGRGSQRFSDVPGEMPAWIKRLSIQEMVEKNWKIEGEIGAPAELSKEKSGIV